MTLLVVLGAWFAAGVLTTLILGPRLRRAAELAGVALEPEPVFPADRSPLRWRLGTLGVVGLLAGSTGMAAAGALPGSAQTIAHHVLGTVGVHVPEATPAPEAASAPVAAPSADVEPAGSSPPTSTATEPGADLSSPAASGSGTGDPQATVRGDDEVTSAPPPTAGDRGGTTDDPPAAEVRPEPSDVEGEVAAPPKSESSDVPPDGVAEEASTTTTTTTTPDETPPAEEPPSDEPPQASGEPTTTTSLPPPPPQSEPAG